MKWMSTVLALWLCASTFARAAEKPNIIFFLSDDQRNDTLGCAGHAILKTPNIDKLAAGGTRFVNAFVTTSICAASRATFLTGHYERSHRFTFRKPPIRKELVAQSYPTLLKQAGYRTGFIGKFGVKIHGNPKQMFDYFAPHGRGFFQKTSDGSKRHETQVAADKAIEFIDSSGEKPFCLSVSFKAAHADDGNKRPGSGHYPWPETVNGMYDDVTVPAPRLGDPKYFELAPKVLQDSMNRDRWFWRWDTPEKYQLNIRAYFRMISGIDHAIGRVMAHLKEQKLADNTVIIYAGDNGYYMGDRGFAGKWSHYEQSLRVPLIVFDPRGDQDVRRGHTPEQMALNVDVPATIVDLAGLDIPGAYQGRSLVPLIQGQTPDDWRDDFFCEHLMHHKRIPKWEGVRGSRYTYARYFEQDPVYEALFDLSQDPDQLKNLVDDAAHAQVLKKMRKRCDQLRDLYGGPYKSSAKGKRKK
ncbi:MAG: sulfatase [Phycisphaeraceae bacterium]|nr:sulfatase [Phycisphaeraceae bacterium]